MSAHRTVFVPACRPACSCEIFSGANEIHVDWARLLITTRCTYYAHPVASECAVCLGPFTHVPLEGDPVTTTRCGHTFHAMCLDFWRANERQPACPCCHEGLA